MTRENDQILNELKEIKENLEYIKSHMTGIDLVLTDDDLESISSAEEDLKKGKTKRLV